MRAALAVLIFLTGITLGSLYLQALPAREPAESWHSTLARYLLVEGLLLLAFALVWALAGGPAQYPAVQIVLLGIAALGMGLQGALFGAFNILDVNSVALTGTELLLGVRLAQRLGRRQSVDQPAGTSVPFLVALMLSYTLAALVVALASPSIVTAFIPCLLVAVAAVVVLATAERGRPIRGFGRRQSTRLSPG